MSDQDKNLSVLPTIEELALMIDDEELRQETMLMIEEVISRGNWKNLEEEIMEIIDAQSKKAMKIEPNAESDELLNKVPTLGQVSTTRDASLGPSTVVMRSPSRSTTTTTSLSMRTLSVSERSPSPKYDEISNTELDAIVEDLNNEALTEMNHKIGVLKVICEQVSDKDEKQKHCIALYEEYITWCEARIDAQMVIHFVNRFHDECSAYLLLYHKIEVNIKRYEDELLCRNDNSQRTDAQNLKQKVLRRRKSNPLKKCLCSQKGERVLTELLKEDFEKVIGSKRITDEEIAKLIELSKSRWEFFFSTLQKYDRYCELRELMNRIFVKQWIDVISLLPNQGFAQADVLNHYRNACDTLELSIPNEKHSTLITVLEEYYKHKEEERVLEELLKRATTSQEARKSQTSEFYY